MFRDITFGAEDLDFIEDHENTNPETEKLSIFLKQVTSNLSADETICLEMDENLIQEVLIAESDWLDSAGIINHIAIQFHHDA